MCRSHDLLQEEIGVTVYNMASVDFDTFYACFLPTFLAGCDGIDASQKAVLAQNFKMDCVSVILDYSSVYLLLLIKIAELFTIKTKCFLPSIINMTLHFN